MNLTDTYKLFRLNGYTAKMALTVARTLIRWKALESEDKVRIYAEPEDENYFDVYGPPEAYTDIYGQYHSEADAMQEMIDSLDVYGCWYVVSEYYDEDTGEWEVADSIGMCTGYNDPTDPAENWYVPDLMQSALDEYEAAQINAYDCVGQL